jgi:hypothetical protein
MIDTLGLVPGNPEPMHAFLSHLSHANVHHTDTPTLFKPIGAVLWGWRDDIAAHGMES